MELLTQMSQAIMSPSKEVFFTSLRGIPQDCCDICSKTHEVHGDIGAVG